MPEYNNNNRGGLWTNKDATSDKHPTFTGKVTIGVDILKELVELAKNKKEATVRIAAWKKVDGSNNDWFSLELSPQFKRKTSNGEPYASNSYKKETPEPQSIADEDLPF
tara:strand:+ start:457 stop:783 length:327 start_codon:yes stop_codon:yes gene_type:complete